jgi:hypothetical protein
VDREIDPIFQEGVIDLLGEQRPAADSGERHVRRKVAGGLDLDPLGFVAGPAQKCANALRLPHGQGAAAGTNTK